MATRIIKNVRGHKFDLLDMIDYYRHLPIRTPKGDASITHINKLSNEINVRTLKSPDDFVFKAEQVKLILLPFNRLPNTDWQILGSLALDGSVKSFNVSKKNELIEMTGKDLSIAFKFKPNFTVKIKVDGEDWFRDAENLGWIALYLAQKGVDMFNIINTQYAVTR